ncbi:MAG: hypothetical protein ACM3XS_00375 [Bacteroidota bacterium]
METLIMIGVGLLFVGALAWRMARAATKGGDCAAGCDSCTAACGRREPGARNGTEA